MKRHVGTIIVGTVFGIGVFFVFQHAQNPSKSSLTGVAPIVQNVQAFILPIAQITYHPIRDFNIPEPVIGARAAILMDAKSGRILFAKQADQRMPIASITKLMSAIVILEHLDLSSTYTVAAEDLNVDGIGPDFVKGEQFIGSDLFMLMLMKSSNDAVSVFATALHEQGFDIVDLMNQKARDFGMTSTHFADPAGLDDNDTYSTAIDVVALMHATQTLPSITRPLTTREASIYTRGGRMYHVTNTNQLLSVIPEIEIGKTGNTTGALGTMALGVRVSTTGDEIMSVILGSADRFGDTRKLITWGKQAHKWELP